MAETIHTQKAALEKAQITQVLTEETRRQQDETKKILDYLRQTRKSRGGTGKPLEVPAHLKDASEGIGVIITDADLKPENG